MIHPLIIIAGPTAVGKTDISIEIAKKLDGEIISADSMQIYKYFNIGSAKPTKEEIREITHYLIDEIDPKERFSVAEYQELANTYIRKVLSENKLPIVVGGTGLYVNSLMYEMSFGNVESDIKLREEFEKDAKTKGNDYLFNKLKEVDKEASQRIHPNNLQRVIRALEIAYSNQDGVKDFSRDLKKKRDYKIILIGLNRNRDELYERINARVDIMFEQGLINEVKELINMGLSSDNISMKGIGYKEVLGYLEGNYDLEEAIYLVKRNTRRYAKRQITWFKRYDQIKWFNISDYTNQNEIIDDIIHYIKGNINLI